MRHLACLRAHLVDRGRFRSLVSRHVAKAHKIPTKEFGKISFVTLYIESKIMYKSCSSGAKLTPFSVCYNILQVPSIKLPTNSNHLFPEAETVNLNAKLSQNIS